MQLTNHSNFGQTSRIFDGEKITTSMGLVSLKDVTTEQLKHFPVPETLVDVGDKKHKFGILQ